MTDFAVILELGRKVKAALKKKRSAKATPSAQSVGNELTPSLQARRIIFTWPVSPQLYKAHGMIIAVDFDGTLVRHCYPQIGEEVPGAVSLCQRLISAGHQLILWTMRDGQQLIDAVEWLHERNIDFWGINCNPDQHWSKSPKAYAQVYIDDAALGCPLIHPLDGRPYADWEAIETLLKGYRVL